MCKAALKAVGILMLGLFLVWPAMARPARIILFRHAEKPVDDSIVHLSERGRERALALTGFFTNNAALTNWGLPNALYAPRILRWTQSRRPIETLEPLAKQLNLPIQTPFPASEYKAFARYLLSSPECDGKNIVVCWVHDYLPELAEALGVKSKSARWKSSVFDRVWVVTWNQDKAKLKELPQQLLPGDAKR